MIKQSKIFKRIYSAYSVLVTIFCIYVFPPAHVLLIKRIAKGNGNRIEKYIPIPVRKYCADHGERFRIIEKAQDRVVYEPAYYPNFDGVEHIYRSPDIYIAELSDVMVHGGSGVLIKGNRVLTDVCENDADNRMKYAYGTIRHANKKAFYLELSDGVEELDAAISLCGLAASNYFHLTLEILSRYEYVKNNKDTGRLTVLLDEAAGMYPQYLDLVHTVLQDVEIKFVPEFKMVRCRKLIYPSMNTWMPINVRKRNDFRISDNVLALSALQNIRKATEQYRTVKTDKKVFISRKNSSLSRIVNEREIEELFRESGYETVCTEELSYREQIELFSTAACIAGATGAAFTNLVYCNPGTVFGCIFPKKSRFCIYSSMAHLVGCKCLFLDAKIEKGVAISNWQYRVDIDKCREYIEALDQMR